MENSVIGHTRGATAEGYIHGKSTGTSPRMVSHEMACILNASDKDTHVKVTIFFTDKNTAGTYTVTVPAHRTTHLRFNTRQDPEPIPPRHRLRQSHRIGYIGCGAACAT